MPIANCLTNGTGIDVARLSSETHEKRVCRRAQNADAVIQKEVAFNKGNGRIAGVNPELSRDEINTLGTYNAERSRGIVHTEAWTREMRVLQARFNNEMAAKVQNPPLSGSIFHALLGSWAK